MLQVRLYRPFPIARLLEALPASVRTIAVLDRTKEPGATGEPLYLDVVTALAEGVARGARATMPRVVGGRYGLSSKEFTPAMVKAVFDELDAAQPRTGFTVGITDDVNGTSLDVDETFTTEHDDVFRAVFYGLGADGTVGANKNTIKIIGEDPDVHVQAYFVYDSKKSGSQTVSHLRFGPRPIQSTYLVREAQFIGCHQFQFIEKVDVLALAAPGRDAAAQQPARRQPRCGTTCPGRCRTASSSAGWPCGSSTPTRSRAPSASAATPTACCRRASSPSPACCPATRRSRRSRRPSPRPTAARARTSCARTSRPSIARIEALARVEVPATATGSRRMLPIVAAGAPAFVRDVVAEMLAGRGDRLPVSAFPIDGTFPSATARWEKRGISDTAPVWEPDLCIQCGNCSFVCPHAVIRTRVYHADRLADAPEGFLSAPDRGARVPGQPLHAADLRGGLHRVHALCRGVPGEGSAREWAARDQHGAAIARPHAGARALSPSSRRSRSPSADTWTSPPCAARSCSSRSSSSPARAQAVARRPTSSSSRSCSATAWSWPMRPAARRSTAATCRPRRGRSTTRGVDRPGPIRSSRTTRSSASACGSPPTTSSARPGACSRRCGRSWVTSWSTTLINAPQRTEYDIRQQRARVAELLDRLAGLQHPLAASLTAVAGQLVRRSVWIVGGDGWAYDIGSGGLDHVLASGRDVNVLVLDTEVYSNTGGQASKSTPLGAAAKFASAGKQTEKKDLALQAMAYGHVYVARVAMGANPQQTLDALREAEAYEGPSLVLAYSHCIAHGIDMKQGLDQQSRAVHSGYWPLVRYNPELRAAGERPFTLDSVRPTLPFRAYAEQELRYRMLLLSDPARGEALLGAAQEAVTRKWKQYEDLAELR